MARKRMIKPDFWKSPKLGQLDHFSRLLFIGLWQVADDHGNGPMEPPLIAAELFPFDLANPTHDILSECSRGTHALAEQGLIRVYEASGRDFYHLPGFKEHQTINRPSNPQYPSPDQGVYEDSLSTHDTLTEHSRHTHPEEKRREEKLTEQEKEGDSDETAQDAEEVREDVQKLCDHLQTQIVHLGSKKPTITKTWKDQARLLLDADKRPEEEAHQLIEWALTHSFWKAHIGSMKKFRDKYDTMRLQAQEQHSGPRGYQSAAEKKVEVARHWLSQPTHEAPSDPWAITPTTRKEIDQ